MKKHVFASLLTFLASVSFAAAVPLPAALDSFFKDGIRLLPEKPAVIQGEVKTRGAQGQHLLQFRKGQTYQLNLNSTYPANIRVVDSESGAVLFSSGASKGEFVAPKSGQYRVLVGSAVGGTGNYSLTVLQKAVPLRLDPPGVRSVPREGLTISSNLTAGDMPDKVRRHRCKTFDIRLDAGKAYQIDMMGAFDTYLRLEDPTGRQIAADDDGGDGLNSRMIINIPANGIYRVVSTSFSGGLGAFTLTIRQK